MDVFLDEGEPDHMVNALSQIPALDHLYEDVRADWREVLQGQTNLLLSWSAPRLLCPLDAFSLFQGRGGGATVRLCGIPKLIL